MEQTKLGQPEEEIEEEVEPKGDIDGATWIKYSISVWDIKKTPKERSFGHPAMFPVELCKRLIRLYTKQGGIVLDPFMGSGSTLIAAKELDRNAIGIEINEDYVKLAKKRLSQQKLASTDAPADSTIHIADASDLDKLLEASSVDFCITSPPYWDILRQKRTADYKDIRPYSESKKDLGNIEDYHQFLKELSVIFGKVNRVLGVNKHCTVIVMDIRKKDRFYPYHVDIIRIMGEVGFDLEDIIIWDRKKEYNNLRALGYPSVFRVNKVHEYILIFKKVRDHATS
jgi:DNA modification methylase